MDLPKRWLHKIQKEFFTIRVDRCYFKQNQDKKELNDEHKIFINCQSLEIFCTSCKKEIYDRMEDQKGKIKKKHNPLYFRSFLVVKEDEEMVFGGNSEYPPSFQKEKKGLCGLKKESFSAYINSIVQLVAAIPLIKDAFIMTKLQQIDNLSLRKLIEAVQKIWEGKYRIYSIHQLHKLIEQSDQKFQQYRNKNPQFILYEILKWIYEQFSYEQIKCQQKEVIGPENEFDQWKKNNNYNYYSLLKEVFNGEFVFEKRCEECKESSKIVENFQSLKVTFEHNPSFFEKNVKVDLMKLVQMAFSWRGKTTELAKTIHRCPKCTKKIQNFFTYVDLPNNLILQFQQSKDSINLNLPNQIDLYEFTEQKAKAMKKGETNTIYEYVGCVGKQEKVYVTHFRHAETGKEYIAKEEIVKQADKIGSNIKLAIYKRKSNYKNKSLSKNIESSIELNINSIMPIPDYWNLYLKHNYKVQPLMNPFICHHGKIKPNTQSKVINGPQKLPIEIYEYLVEEYGGRKNFVKEKDDQCKSCKQKIQLIKEIKKSEREMAGFADKLSNKKYKVAIVKEWLEKWKKYLYETNSRNYKIFDNPRPMKIVNDKYFDKKTQFTDQKKYKKISCQVWYFLRTFYGGGPVIAYSKYEPNIVLKTSVDLRYKTICQYLEEQGISSNFEKEEEGVIIEEEEEQNSEIEEAIQKEEGNCK